jgi:ABC-type transport system involved in multi-copper enzyme maturation permease subunit
VEWWSIEKTGQRSNTPILQHSITPIAMHATLLYKILREQRTTLLSCAALLMLFGTLLTLLYRTFGDTSADTFQRIPPGLLNALFGGMIMGLNPLDMWLIGMFVHPLTLTLFSVFTVAVTSRTLAGEIEQGTVDILLSYPLARWKLVMSSGVVLLLGNLLLASAIWWGMQLGLYFSNVSDTASWHEFRWVELNLFALFAAMGGVAFLFSARASERGRAVGFSIAFIVLSFFINLLAQLWSKIAWMDVVSVFHYYRPQPILISHAAPYRDLMVLLTVAVVTFAAAVITFQRRDIATV